MAVRKRNGETNPAWYLVAATCVVIVGFSLIVPVAAADVAYRFDMKWGTGGTESGNFSEPMGIATDSSGNIFVADMGNHRIQKFNATGGFLAAWGKAGGGSGSGNGEFSSPSGVAVDSGDNVYVSEYANHRVQKFTNNGEFLLKFGTPGSGDGELLGPSGVAVDSEGNIYVGDSVNFRVQKFSPSGVFLAKWSTWDSYPYGFSGIGGIAADNTGNIYVADPMNCYVSKFNQTGSYLAGWYLDSAAGIDADASGDIYVTSLAGSVTRYTPSGSPVATWGSPGSGDGELDNPNGVAVHAASPVYVSDRVNNWIQKFALCNPDVTGITPDYASPSGTVTAEITGARFNTTSPPAIVLSRAGYGEIGATGITVHSPTWISCSFDLSGRAIGSWDVVVTNPGGYEGVLEDGFSITGPAPVVTGITPGSAINTRPAHITNLSGEFFVKPVVNLTMAGQENITATGVTAVSTSRITCTFNLTGKPGGTWDVVVTNPDGSSGTLAGGFTTGPPIPLEIVGWGLDSDGQASPPEGRNYTAVGAGWDHSIALRTDGSVVGWGRNDFGEASPPAGYDYSAIAAGASYGLALKSDGSLAEWGSDLFGGVPPDGNDYVAIAAGTYHSLALKSDGSVVGWRADWKGQASPPAGNNYTAIAAGGEHSLALKNDGTIVCWGRNTEGQATPPAGNNFTAIAAGFYHSLALRDDGTVVCWGNNNFGQRNAPAGSYTAIAGGYYHSLALRSDGTLAGWGNNTYGQTAVPAGNSYYAVSSGSSHGIALRVPPPIVTGIYPDYGHDTGTIAITNLSGKNFNVTPGPAVVLNRTGYADIPATGVTVVSPGQMTCSFDLTGKPIGSWHVLVTNPDGYAGVLEDGFAIVGGAPTVTGISPGSGINTRSLYIANLSGTNFVRPVVNLTRSGQQNIAATGAVALASTRIACTFNLTGRPAGLWNVVVTNPDGTSARLANAFTILPPAPLAVEAWGDNSIGQAAPQTGRNYTAVAGGYGHSIALRADGSIVAWGQNLWEAATPPAGRDYTHIAANNYYNLALKSDGSIFAWGDSPSGTPAGSGFVAISAGYDHGLALRDNGSIAGWGRNAEGQAVPPAGNNYTAISAGMLHSLALTDNGTIVSWGDDPYGQAAAPVGNYAAISAGRWHSLAIRENGSIAAWGTNYYGLLDVPAGNDYTTISAGMSHSLALRKNGSVVAWGDGSSGQATSPGGTNYTAIAVGLEHSLALRRPQPVVTGIVPKIGRQGTIVKVRNLSGQEFAAGAKVRLKKGAKTIRMKPITVVNSTLITGKFRIPATARVGKWNVMVTNPGGQNGTLARGFTVKA